MSIYYYPKFKQQLNYVLYLAVAKSKDYEKKHSVGIKCKVAMEAIKDQKTINEIGCIYEVQPNQVCV